MSTTRSSLAHRRPQSGVLLGSSDDGAHFAAWDCEARHVDPRIGASRFSAWLAPFVSREAATEALIEHGCGEIADG